MLVIVQSGNFDTHLQSHAFIEAHSFNPQLFSRRLFFSGEGLGMAKHQQRPQKPSYANISSTQFLSTLTVALPLHYQRLQLHCLCRKSIIPATSKRIMAGINGTATTPNITLTVHFLAITDFKHPISSLCFPTHRC
jgi:hypothetical protein